jgi:hypothetical protein
MVEGYSVRQLSRQSGHSPATLYRMLDFNLNHTPQTKQELDAGKYLLFDGSFLHRQRSVIALMDAQTHTLVAGEYGIAENSLQLLPFFEDLKRGGLQPHSFTIDGNPHVINTLKKVWPDVIIQRCLVHIQRQGLSWCRRNPRTTYARRLRKIFLDVTDIRTEAQQKDFLGLIAEWEDKYGVQIHHKSETGYVFSDIKRARSMLLRALPDMFHYLHDPQIPNSTNGLESYFSRLKAHYRQHRGLNKKKRKNYFAWYFHLVPK